MVNWQVTAATIYCGAVDNEVTIMVYKDGSVKCVGHREYAGPEIQKQMKKKSLRLKKELRCTGPDCELVTGYRDKVLREESEQAESAGL